MRIKSKATTGLFCFLLAAFSVCNAKEPSTPPISAAPSPYPVMDSGVWADGLHDPLIRWLDNDRLIFKGTAKESAAYRYLQLQLWDLKTNKIVAHSEPALQISVCVRDGYIVYTLEDEKKNLRRFAGEFGKEKPFPFPVDNKQAVYYPLDCRVYDDSVILEKRKTRAINLLRKRDGYLDLRPRTGIESTYNNSITFFRPGASKGILLPIGSQDTQAVDYYHFRDAYFIWRPYGAAINPVERSRWKNSNCEKTWWLMPAGEVNELCIPYGPWGQGGSVGFYPTRKGIFVRYDTFKSSKDPGDAGGYLVKEGKWIRVVVGHLRGPAVSPDGCKVAFAYAYYSYRETTRLDDPGRVSLKMFNFCTEEKKS